MNQQVKSKREFPYVTLILAVTLVLVVAILGYTVFDTVGIIGRLDNAAKSDNFKMNENHVDVYRYHVAQNQLYYEYMYIQWGIYDDPTGGMVKNRIWDAATYINWVLPNYLGTGAFDATAYEYAKQYMAYCEGAREEGKYDEFKEKVSADVAEYIESLESLAEANQVSLSTYIHKWIGKGVSKADVEAAMEYYYIGIEYADYLFEKKSDAVTAEQIKDYMDKNKANFYTTTVTSYTIANYEKMHEAIEKCKTAEEVKTYLVDYYLDQKFESQYTTNITNKKIEDADKDKTKADIRTTLLAMNEIGDATAVFTDKDTDDYKKACYTIANTINSSVKTQVNKVTETEHKWSDPKAEKATDIQKWLFADDGRKEGDTNIIKTENKDTDGKVTSTTYTWYVVEEALGKDTEKTKDMYYVLLSDDKEGTENGKTAAQKAEAFWTALNADKTPEKFGELVAEYAPGVSGEVNERLSYESIKGSNEELANWLYAEGRKEGDIIKVENKDKDDKVTGYYIAYFVQENEETWSLTAREAIAGEQLTEWYEDAVERFHITIDYEPETTAATTEHDHDHDHDHDHGTEASTDKGTEAGTEKATEPSTEAPTTDAAA